MKHRQLLPHTLTYDGSQEPMSLERLAAEYPSIKGAYLPELFRHLLNHFKETGDAHSRRVRSLRHGDDSLLTMLTAFQRQDEPPSRHTYLSMSKRELDQLSFHETLLARDVDARVMRSAKTPAFLSSFYRERVTLSGHRQHVFCLAFDKTNRRLFTGSDDFLVKVWDTKTGYLIHTIRGHQNVITDIAINEENTLVATASSDGYVRVWSLQGFAPVVNLKSNTSTTKPFTTIKFSSSPRSETRYLMATSEDGLVRLWKWDRDTLKFFDKDSPITFGCKFKAGDRLRCSSFNYTGTQFTVAGDDGFVYVFSTLKYDKDKTGMTLKGNEESIEKFEEPRVGRGRKRVASALFPDKNGQLSQPVTPIAHLEGHMGSVTDVAYSHDGKRILSGCQDGTARIWSYDKKEEKWNSIVLDIQKEYVDAVIVSPKQGPRDATQRSPNGQLRPQAQTPLKDPSEIGTLIPPCSQTGLSTGSIATTENGPQDDSIKRAPQDTGTSGYTLAGASVTDSHTGDIEANREPSPERTTETRPKVSMIAWSADDRLCIVATTVGDIKVFHSYTGKLSCILKGHEGETYAVEAHPCDPYTVLSAGYDGNVILWDLKRKQVISHQNYPSRVFLECKFSDDGMQYALSDDDGSCTLFKIGGLDKECAQVKSWQRGQYFYTDYVALRFAPDGSFVDEQTLQPPHLMPPSPIIDWRGVEYPNQKALGYGRNLPIAYKGFEKKDARRAECYDLEEEEFRESKPIQLPALDRAALTRRRREFVKNDDEDDVEIAETEPQIQWTAPVTSNLLPDDSDDEDYHDEANGGENTTSDESVSEEGVSETLYMPLSASEDEEDEDGPVTRSRAGRLRVASESAEETSDAHVSQLRDRGRRRHANRSSGITPTDASRATRATRNSRRRDGSERSDDEEEMPVRPRMRKRGARISYMESDTDDSEAEIVDVVDQSDASGSDQDFVDDENEEEQALEGQHDTDRKGKRRHRSVTVESDDDFVQAESSTRAMKRRVVNSGKPDNKSTSKRSTRWQREKPRDLSPEEIPLYEPKEWLRTTERTVTKYLPQVGDQVALLTEGHAQYWKNSEMTALFDPKHGPFKCDEPVIFGKVISSSWHVGPPTFCRLKLRIRDMINIYETLTSGCEPIWDNHSYDVTIDYTDEDGCPEFLVLFERFMVSMQLFFTLRLGQKVDAMYGDTKYSGTISSVKKNSLIWNRARAPSPWAFYHITWDDEESQPDDLSPWEVVPSGEDFDQRYNVGPQLSAALTRRACNIIEWLSASEEFQLYVSQVDFYQYPNYLSQIAYPICLDIVMERLNNGFYRQLEALIEDVELIRKNAQRYNHETSMANKNAVRMANFFKSRITNLHMPISWARGGRKRTLSEESEYEEDESFARESEDPSDESEFVADDDED